MTTQSSLPSDLAQVRGWLRQGELVQAQALCREILVRHPYQLDALCLLAELLLKAGMTAEAVSPLRCACAASAHDPELHYLLASTLLRLGRDDEAVTVLTTAQRSRIAHAPSIRLMATLLHQSGRLDDARRLMGDAVFRLGSAPVAADIVEHWQALMPEDPVPLHRLASMRGVNAPERAADDYVTYLFDRYAESFDASLNRLGYQAPALIRQQLREAAVMPNGQWDVLDAGCGTGLCASVARPFARHLTGVDLSPAMLAKAAERGGYDDLVVGEITEYLRQNPERFDLIVSTDTLIYFGDLTAVLTQVARALRTAGWLAFTAEDAPSAIVPKGYCLNANGRYGHSPDYVRHAVATAGLVMRSINEGVIRQGDDKPVAGWVVLAQRQV